MHRTTVSGSSQPRVASSIRSSPVEAVVERLHGVRRIGGRLRASCPAHGSRGTTLSIGEGSDGRVLLQCFAGCDVNAIVAAIGLEVKDLFPATERPVTREHRRASRAEVRAFLVREVGRQRARRLELHPQGQPEYVAADVNEARMRSNAIYGTKFAPIARYAWEGFAPHDSDPLWPALFARALDEVRFERRCKTDSFALPDETDDAPLYFRDLVLAGDRAAAWLRAEGRRC